MAPASLVTVTPSSISASTQYSACSLFLLTLRLPPVKRWIVARQKEGRGWLVWLTITPIFALFVLDFIFIVNEEMFKGIDSFSETPSNE